jgi:hypothetical protein
MKIPQFENKDQEIEFIVKNQNKLIAFKKATFKKADTFSFSPIEITKAIVNNTPVEEPEEVLKVKVVINSTNFLDSHGDVHIKGLWNKSINENKNIVHLQEHEMAFDKIISDGEDLNVFTQQFTFKQLGYNYEGKTECLIFESKVKEDRNEFMYEQYSKGFVKNHSVGMSYVKMVLCVNNSMNTQEFENWNKYFAEVANQDTALEKGYFWAVLEAKLIEGSAVVIGSNPVTPTLENNMKAVITLSENEPADNATQKMNKNEFKNLLNKF